MRRRPGSLPIALLRHVGVLAIAVVALYVVGTLGPIEQQTMTWVLVAAAVGAVAGLVDRGWLGLLFLEIGLALGIAAGVVSSHGHADETAAAVAAAAWLYLATLLAGAAAYLIVRLVRRQLA